MRLVIKIIFLFCMFLYAGSGFANTFNLDPVGSLPSTVAAGQTVSALYKITSAGTFPVGQYHIIYALLSNASSFSQDLTVDNSCGIFSISPRGCILKLDIVAPISGPIKVCDDYHGQPGLNCYIPSDPKNFLNVIADQSPILTVSPSATILGANASQIFTIINTSTTTSAINVTLTIPSAVQAQLSGPPVYNGCGAIAPMGSCTVTITASATPSAQSGIATVQGTNTAAAVVTAAITTGAAPALTVSPLTTFLGPNDSQQFIVVNTSTTTAATSITITIPANVETQLAGSPIYSGCGSIAPLGTCTITVAANASPAAQSGIATVQGTNTALPAPTVTITTGAAPALTVSPLTTVLGPNGTQQFIVTNTSTTTAATSVTITIPSNVQAQLLGAPVYSGCGSIAPLGTCTVTLTANAAPTAQSGVATIQGTNTAAPAPTVNITTGAAPTLTVSPSTTVLGPNGSQIFTVTNTSASIAAQNVTMTIPANVQGQLTGQPIYAGCTSISALGTCTVTITAVALPNAQSGIATVQGTNTAAPAPTVAITTGAAPTLTVSPTSANVPNGGSQIFTVTNAGTITAQNITMTVPANVQTQLIGLPTYSSACSSLPAGSSACTITIQAIASPSGQNGVASVQGTNTAAPSPQVNIFILPVCSILGGSTVINTGFSIITGGVCVAPGVAITGFPPGVTNPSGQIHSNDSAATADHSDAVNLYNTIVGLTCDNPLSSDLGGMTLTPGVYCFNTAATLVAGGTLILNGSATDKWYIQIGTTLTTGANSNVVLTGGALPGNVYWQIGNSATFGANTAFTGQIVAFTSLTLGAGMSNNGRLWVLNAAITMDTNNISP